MIDRRTLAVLVLAILAAVAVVALAGQLDHERAKVAHERELRRHACHQLDELGADATNGADVAACTFPVSRKAPRP